MVIGATQDVVDEGATGVAIGAAANDVSVTGASRVVLSATSASVEITSHGTTVDIDGQTGVTLESKANDVAVTGASRVTVAATSDVVDVRGQTGVTMASTAHDVTVTAASQLTLAATASVVDVNGATGVELIDRTTCGRDGRESTCGDGAVGDERGGGDATHIGRDVDEGERRGRVRRDGRDRMWWMCGVERRGGDGRRGVGGGRQRVVLTNATARAWTWSRRTARRWTSTARRG